MLKAHHIRRAERRVKQIEQDSKGIAHPTVISAAHAFISGNPVRLTHVWVYDSADYLVLLRNVDAKDRETVLGNFFDNEANQPRFEDMAQLVEAIVHPFWKTIDTCVDIPKEDS